MPEDEATPTATSDSSRDRFLSLSVVLTGYERIDLEGTGLVDAYFDEMVRIVGARRCDRLWAVSHALLDRFRDDPARLEQAVQTDILGDPLLGPLARNTIGLWYMATWNQLPQAWRNAYGASALDTDHIVSAAAYTEGVIWRTMSTHPPGAKQPGFGSWSRPPEIEPPLSPG